MARYFTLSRKNVDFVTFRGSFECQMVNTFKSELGTHKNKVGILFDKIADNLPTLELAETAYFSACNTHSEFKSDRLNQPGRNCGMISPNNGVSQLCTESNPEISRVLGPDKSSPSECIISIWETVPVDRAT